MQVQVQVQRTIAYLATGQDTAQTVLALPSTVWKPFSPTNTYPLGDGAALWVQMQLSVNTPNAKADASADAAPATGWRIELPKPFIDTLELHPINTNNTDGKLRVQTAGDTIANQAWPAPGLYPQVILPSMPAGQHTVLLRITNNVPANFKLALISADQAQAQKLDLLIKIGFAIAVLLCMVLVSGCLAVIYRESAYALYSVYALMTALFGLAYSGAGAYLLWPTATQWSAASIHTSALLSVVAQLLFCFVSFDAVKIHPVWRPIIWTTTLLSLAAAVAIPLVELNINIFLVAFLLPLVLNIVLMSCIVLSRLRQGDLTAKLWTLAYIPLLTLILLTALDHLGFVSQSVVGYHWLVYAIALEVPILLVALMLRAKSRHAKTVQTQLHQQLDPLTGCIVPRAYNDAAMPMWDKAAQLNQDLAVVYVQVMQPNLPYLGTASHAIGIERIVRVLRTVFRQEDTFAQVRDDVYAVLMPGKALGESLQNRLIRLVAQLHMLSHQLKTEYPLRTRVSACTNRSMPMPWPDVHRILLDKFNEDSSWDKRSIRIVSKPRSQRFNDEDLSDFWALAAQAEANSDGLPKL